MRRTTKRTGTALRNWLGLRQVYVPALFRKKSALGLLPLLLLAIAGLFYLTGRDQAGAAWFDEGWHYRIPYSISNSGSAIAAERKIKIEVDTATLIAAGKMQSDCDDVRFTDATGALLEYFIDTASGDCDTGSTDFYIKVSSLITGNQTVFLYYGNPSAARGRANDFFDTSSEGTLGEGLVGYYPMNETTANTCTGGSNDTCDYALTNDGAWNNGTTYTASGKMNGGTSYDGVNDYINVSPSALPTEQISLSVWVKVDAHKNYNRFITNLWAGEGDWLLYSNTGSWVWGIRSPGTTQASVTSAHGNTTGWTHLVATYDGTTQRLYVNGTEVGTPLTHSVTLTQNQLHFSSDNSVLDGSLDDVRIYRRSLSSNEVSAIYNSGNGYSIPVPLTFTPSSTTAGTEEIGEAPIAYWKFDEGNGTTANDSSSGQHNATVAGAQWQTEDACVSGRCLSFDGTDDYVYKTDTAVLSQTGAITLSGWIKTDTISDDPYGNNTINTIVSKWDNATDKRSYILGINYNRDGNIVFGVSHDGVGYSVRYTDEILEANTWYHITATYDGDSSYKLFINGQEHSFPNSLNVGDPGTGIDDNDARVGIGDSVGWAGAPGYFSGLIDEVKIYPYARSAAQVKADFTARGGTTGSGAQFGGGGNSSLSQGLVAYYPMEESTADTCTGGTNDTCDASGNGNDAAWNADTAPAAGKYGTALSFDGTGDYAVTADADALDTTGNWSISGWVYNSNANLNHGWQYLVMKGTGYGQQHIPYLVRVGYNQLAAGMITNYTEDTDSVSISSLTAVDTWMHFVAVFNDAENTMTIYINGQQQTVATNTLSPNANTTGVGLGATANGSGPFNGRLDEVRIYNRALSSSEATALYSSGRGPVAHWKLDENTGTSISDVSGNSLTGSFTSSPQWTQGRFGSALQFSGSNYVSVADNANLDVQNDITIALWVKPSLLNSSAQLIMGKGVYSANTNRQYGMRLNSSNRWQGFLYSGSSVYSVEATGFTPSVGRWDHVAMVREQATGLLKMYVNGVLINTTENATGDLNDTSYAFALGREGESGGNYFTGGIDDVQIYDFALTQKQITNVMNGRSVSDVAVGSPVGHAFTELHFDEGYGTTANDSSPNGNSGTLTNMAAPATTTSGWTAAGKYGKAVTFDGDNDYVSVAGSYPTNTAARTLCAWIKSADTSFQGNADHVVNYGTAETSKAFGIMMYTGNTWWFYGHGGSYDINTGIAADTNWHNHCVTYDGSTVTYFYDGKQVASAARTLATTSGNFQIGQSPDLAASNDFNGSVDEVLFYNYALTAEEVRLQFNQGKAAVFGSGGTESDGVTPSSAASREYCPPGETATCSAPTLEWQLDEGSGTTAADTSGNANTGTLTNGPTWTQGKHGGAVRFDGNDDYIVVPTAVANRPPHFTISSWFYLDSSIPHETYATIIDRPAAATHVAPYYDYHIRINDVASTPVLFAAVVTGQVYSAADTISSTTPITFNEWHHVSLTYDGTTMSLYLDGKLDSSKVNAGAISHNAQDVYIGTFKNVTSGNFPGMIDQLRIYNYARPLHQVAWEYNKGAPSLWYKFDECQGTTAYNSALNADGEAAGNDGTIVIGGSGSNTSVGSCEGSSGQAWADGASGKLGSSVELDGTNDYVNLPNNLFDTDNQGSISLWMKTNAIGSNQNIFGSFSNSDNAEFFSILLAADGYIQFGNRNPQNFLNSVKTLSADTWYHIVLTSDGSTWKFYIDGEEQPYTIAAGSNAGNWFDDADSGTNSYVLGFSKRPGSYSSYFNGQIDDVRIYRYPVTPAQVKNLYSNGAVNFN